MSLVDPQTIAAPFLEKVRATVSARGLAIRLVGVLAGNARASRVYSNYAAEGCERVGIAYDLRQVRAEQVSRAVFEASEDPEVHGILVFYPVFGGSRDRSLQNELDPEKDVEGLHAFWTRRLYHDVRTIDGGGKAILPCTPLGIVKALGVLGVTRRDVPARRAAEGLVVTIFNRSEVVGRPLAAMLAHDGARVYSFDIDGVHLYTGREAEPIAIERAQALAESELVVTGVPSRKFPLVHAAELREGAVCINFSHYRNLADDVGERARLVLNRVGPVTIAMLLRNTLRLYENFHAATS